MPDVTGRVYEAFTEFILRRLGYRDEWTEGSGRQYLYEKHPSALCHKNPDICMHARECDAFSTTHHIPYGPWYDPDFFLLDNGEPRACIHATHWSSPKNSPFKFWRTIEDHFQYKLQFGRRFLSINLVFEALDEGMPPTSVVNAHDVPYLHGWSPAVGRILATSFDATILFPRSYFPLRRFAERLPLESHGNARERRKTYDDTWSEIYAHQADLKSEVDRIVTLCGESLSGPPSSQYTVQAISRLQSVCFEGRKRALDIHSTTTRYRKGIQQAFILHEMIARRWGSIIGPDESLSRVLQANTRFLWKDFGDLLGLPETCKEADVDNFRLMLASIPVRVDQGVPDYLLVNGAGLEHATWNEDLARFILGLRNLPATDLASFRQALFDLFVSYRTAYGINDTLADLFEPARTRTKVMYVAAQFLNINAKQDFVNAVMANTVTPGTIPPHQTLVRDVHNWPLIVLLIFYNLGSYQHIAANLPTKFERVYGHSLRQYAFMGDLGKLVSHLLQGVAVGQYFSKGARMTESEFYSAIWPLVAECLWEGIQEQGNKPLPYETVMVLYRYRNAMRIIAASDLEPISFLFRRAMPTLTAGPTLRGAFNQVSAQRGWGRQALTTDTAGQDPRSGTIIQTQAVVGAKNIDHKVKELAGRLRSVHLNCLPDGTFVPNPHPGHHYLVVDGDWPITSKLNLYEAGFEGIYEIGELDRLAQHLATLKEDPSHGQR